MNQITSALFDNRDDAKRAIHALRDHGIPEDRISVLALANDGSGRASDMDVSDRISAPGKDESISTTTPADAAKGAAEGAFIGAGLGLLAALSSIFVPGFGLVAAGGALATALGGAAAATAGGMAAGGVTGYLVDMGMDQQAAHETNEAVQRGGILVTVHPLDNTATDTSDIETLFAKYNGRPANAAASAVSNPDTLDAKNHRLLGGTLEGPVSSNVAPSEIDTEDDPHLDVVTGSEGSASSRVNAERVGS